MIIMATFVFVHGAWHGSWCWDKVVSLIQQKGHNAITVDLPCRAGDDTKHSSVTVNDYAEKICSVINCQSEPVILVGHSMGGIMISQASEFCSTKIAKLVYVCAFLPADGQSLLDLANHETGADAKVLPNLTMDQDNGFSFFDESASLKDIFYEDCSDADVKRARVMLVPESLSAFGIPVALSQEKSFSVPRYYIECEKDRAIPIALQRHMQEKIKCEKVVTLDASHSPFLSMPKELVDHLISFI